jgi:hypothetical protein
VHYRKFYGSYGCKNDYGIPLVMALAPEKGDAIKDTRGFKLAGELGKSMVQIAKATASLKRLNSGSQELWMTRGNLQTTFIER